jgi:hypothetical protein
MQVPAGLADQKRTYRGSTVPPFITNNPSSQRHEGLLCQRPGRWRQGGSGGAESGGGVVAVPGSRSPAPAPSPAPAGPAGTGTIPGTAVAVLVVVVVVASAVGVVRFAGGGSEREDGGGASRCLSRGPPVAADPVARGPGPAPGARSAPGWWAPAVPAGARIRERRVCGPKSPCDSGAWSIRRSAGNGPAAAPGRGERRGWESGGGWGPGRRRGRDVRLPAAAARSARSLRSPWSPRTLWSPHRRAAAAFARGRSEREWPAGYYRLPQSNFAHSPPARSASATSTGHIFIEGQASHSGASMV